jgi:hypothetical protein
LKEQYEEYEYTGSPATKKTIHVEFTTFVLEFVEANFAATTDVWIAKIKQLLGDYADLGGTILSIDLREIASVKSEYPLIQIDTQIDLRYVQSFEMT